jgi:hypothetical protein
MNPEDPRYVEQAEYHCRWHVGDFPMADCPVWSCRRLLGQLWAEEVLGLFLDGNGIQ